MATASPVRRQDLAPGECLCDHCIGKCCRYFSFPIDEPTSRGDYEAIRRHMLHAGTLAYVEKGTWYFVVMARCNYLLDDYRCAIYHDRPKICRDYTTDGCEYDEDWSFDKVFETPDQLLEYVDAIFPARGRLPKAEPLGPPGPFFSIPIETPTTWDDYDAFRWYLAHGRTLIYVEDFAWFVVVLTGSDHLTVEDRARLREEDGPEAGRPFDRTFETPEQLWEYAAAVLPARRLAVTVPDLVTIGGLDLGG